MQVVYERCAGLDVDKRTVVACATTPKADGHPQKDRQTFSTMTVEICQMRDWLKSLGVTHVAMESTGVFWKPIYNVLEGHFELLVVNAQHIKAVAFPQDGSERRRVDCGFIAPWLIACQLCSLRPGTGSA